MRSCGSCTKCCDGWLSGDVKGHAMYPGKPCFFVESSVGCKDYHNRPYSPCITFSCEWLKNENIPEHMYPENCGYIIADQEINNIKFLKVVRAPNGPNVNDLSWLITNAIKNNINFVWDTDDKMFWIGSNEFIETMNSIVYSNDKNFSETVRTEYESNPMPNIDNVGRDKFYEFPTS